MTIEFHAKHSHIRVPCFIPKQKKATTTTKDKSVFYPILSCILCNHVQATPILCSFFFCFSFFGMVFLLVIVVVVSVRSSESKSICYYCWIVVVLKLIIIFTFAIQLRLQHFKIASRLKIILRILFETITMPLANEKSVSPPFEKKKMSFTFEFCVCDENSIPKWFTMCPN